MTTQISTVNSHTSPKTTMMSRPKTPTRSRCRAGGEEVLTIVSPNEEWSVYLPSGGGITNAFVGTPSEPIVWVNPTDRPVERDEDGTYVVHID
jgi:hypothetical protein